jgi:hypothetical protein
MFTNTSRSHDEKLALLHFEFEKTKQSIINDVSRKSNDVLIDIDEHNEPIETTSVDDMIDERINNLYYKVEQTFPGWSFVNCLRTCFGYRN